jgi:hypothetical protein
MEFQETTMVQKKYAAPLPLDGLSFRIAILSPGSLDDILHMTLEVRSLEDSDLDYEAISYCWSQGIGNTIEDTWDFEVKCDEGTINVPRNLGRALRRLRYRDRQRRLWMDSVCIDQQNIEEKNCQVARMGQIFATATRVVVWLGEEDENTESAYKTIELWAKAGSVLARQDQAKIRQALLPRTKQVCEVAGLGRVSRNEIQAMADLLQRAWFERAWVYQESVLARETLVNTGSLEIAGITIVSMVESGNNYGMSYIGSKPGNLFALDRAYAMFLPLKKISGFGFHFWRDLFWVLRARRGSKTSDPRDLIYSVLGVAASGKHPPISPDYALSWKVLYVWVAKKIIEETHNLDIFGELIPVPSALDDGSRALPSWVPDWRVQLDGEKKFSIVSNNKAGPKTRLFFSTGASKVSLAKSDGSFSRKLKLNGIYADTVGSIEPSNRAGWRAFEQFLEKSVYWPTKEPMRLARIKMLSLDGTPWNPDTPNYVPNGAFHFVKNYEKYLNEDTETIDTRIFNEMGRIGRKVLLTSGGYFGVAPESVKVGHRIFLFPGAEFPVLLRKRTTKGEIEYELIGECYIHGLMKGQGMKMARERADPQYASTSDDDSWLSRLDKEEVSLEMEEIVIS